MIGELNSMDSISAEKRSELMSRIGSRGTGPERAVESMLRGIGVPCITHDGSLPGRPDFSFPSARKAIFAHGCFWHSHSCRGGRLPESNAGYWAAKLEGNSRRDRRALRKLRRMGWSVLVVWECRMRKNPAGEAGRIARFLSK